MNNLAALLFTTSGYCLSAYPAVTGFSWPERLAYSYLLGSGTTTLFWFILGRVGMPLNPVTWLLSVVISFIFFALTFGGTKSKGAIAKFKLHPAIILPLLLWLSVGLYDLYQPVTAWDSLALYDFRGSLISLTHSLASIATSTYDVSYPLLTSLMHAALYQFGGDNPSFFYALYLLALSTVLYGYVSKKNAGLAVLLTSLTLGSSILYHHATLAYTNLPYAAILVSAVIIFMYSFQNPRLLYFSGILFGISTWVRSAETFWILGIILLLSRLKKHPLLTSFSIATVLAIKSIWSTYQQQIYHSYRAATTSSISKIPSDWLPKLFSQSGIVFQYIFNNLFRPYIGLWLILLGSSLIAIYHFPKLSKELRWLYVFIYLSILMTLAGIVIFSLYYNGWEEIGDSAKRMIIFLIPLILFAAVETKAKYE